MSEKMKKVERDSYGESASSHSSYESSNGKGKVSFNLGIGEIKTVLDAENSSSDCQSDESFQIKQGTSNTLWEVDSEIKEDDDAQKKMESAKRRLMRRSTITFKRQ